MRSRTFLFVLCVLVVPAWHICAQDAPTEADRLFSKAVDLHRAGDLIGAVDAYAAGLKLVPGQFEMRSNLATAYQQLGRYEEAIAEYRQALEASGGHARIRFGLGSALKKQTRIGEAAAEFEKVVAAEPSLKTARLALAECYLQMGENRKVIDLLGPHEPEYGDDLAYAYVLGSALLWENETARGQVLIDRIFRNRNSPLGHVLMGTAHLKTQDWPAAVKAFAQAVALDPNLPAVHSLHAQALLGTGDNDAAVRAFRRELERNPNDFDANLHLGTIRRREQKHDEARLYLTRALQMRPRDPAALYSMAGLDMAEGRNEEARASLEKLVAESPDFVEAHVQLATIYYRLQRKTDGDRHRAIVDKLNAEIQARQRGAQEALGAPYRGGDAPRVAPPKPPK